MTAPIAERGRIVVGVDGSDQSTLALRWALHLAAITGSDVEAVMAWQYPVSYGWTLAATGWDPREDAEKALFAIIEDTAPGPPGRGSPDREGGQRRQGPAGPEQGRDNARRRQQRPRWVRWAVARLRQLELRGARHLPRAGRAWRPAAVSP
jgi:nucleotide-binding universal stress UspA family protein